MGLPSWRKMSSLSLVDQIERGLPLQAAERIAQVMARGNPRAKYTLLSRSTWSRLRKRPRRHLTREVSERVHRIARVLLETRRLCTNDDSAMVRFLNRPHLLLGGRAPQRRPGIDGRCRPGRPHHRRSKGRRRGVILIA
jgi:putative toxin-antitoxin system antitoxin component (TIGR02293 family)